MFKHFVLACLGVVSFVSAVRSSVQYDYRADVIRVIFNSTGDIVADDMRFEGPIIAESMTIEITGNLNDASGLLLVKFYPWDVLGMPDSTNVPLFEGQIPLARDEYYVVDLNGVSLPRRVFVVVQALDNDQVPHEWYLEHTWDPASPVGYTEKGGWEQISGVWERTHATGVGAELSMWIEGELVFAQPPCPGDTNESRSVNGADLSLLMAQFGMTIFPTAGADFNGDSVVNGLDLTVLLANWQTTCTP